MSNEIKNKDLNSPNLHIHLLLGMKRSSVFIMPPNSKEKPIVIIILRAVVVSPYSVLKHHALCQVIFQHPLILILAKTSLRWPSPSPSPNRREQKSAGWLRILPTVIQAGSVHSQGGVGINSVWRALIIRCVCEGEL